MNDEQRDAGEAGADEALERVEPTAAVPAEADPSKSGPEDRAEAGPFDLSEVPTMRPYVDMGGIKVAPREGLQIRLEVDERAKRVVAVTLGYRESQLQLQAFAAPKSTGLWNRTRQELAAQFAQQSVATSEVEGPLGTELMAATPVPEAQGGGTREARFVGVDGPRWMLRGVIIGKAVTDPETYAAVLEVFREAVVVRGDQPLPPGELLALKVPAGAQPSGTAPGPQA